MSTDLAPELKLLKFPTDMLVKIALGGDPADISSQYGYDWDEIEHAPHYLKQIELVERDLFQEGEITRVIAGVGLHQAVESVNDKLLTPRTLTPSDIVKMGDFLMKVKNSNKEQAGSEQRSQFTIEFNFPEDVPAGTTVKIQTNQPEPEEKEVEEEPDDELDELDVEAVDAIEPDWQLPEEIEEAFANTDTGGAFGVTFEDGQDG